MASITVQEHITVPERTNILKLVAGMFNAAPGAAYLSEFTDAYLALNKDLGALANALGQTGAFKSLYPSFLTAEEFADKFLDTLGLKDNTEAQDWVQAKVNAGESFASVVFQALVAIDASTSDDFKAARDQLTNKAAAAEYYSVTLQASSDDLATLQNVVAKVTDDPKSVEAANDANQGGSGKTFTLTTGVDIREGTAGNDTFNAFIDTAGTADRSTFTAQDTIDGGAGIDTLNIYTDVGNNVNDVFPAFASVKNVEIVNVFNDNAAAAFGDASKFQGVQQLWQIGAAAAVTNLEAGSAAGFRDIAALAGDVTAKTGAASITVAVDNIGEGNTATSVVTKGANTINVAGSLAEDAGVFTLDARAAATTATTLTVNTAVATTLDTSNGANAGVTTVNAADSTGGVTYSAAAAVVNVTTGTGDDDLTIAATTKASVTTGEGDDTVTASGILDAETVINLGAGDDRLVLQATPAAGATLTGGEGTDTLAMLKAGYAAITTAGWSGGTAAEDAAALAKITGFEALEFTDALADAESFDISKIAGITSFVAGAGVNSTESATVTGVTSGSSVTLAGAVANNGTLVVEVKDAATGEADVLNLKLNKAIADDADTTVDLNAVAVTVTAADVETVNVEATGVRGAATEIDLNDYTLTLNNDELVTLNISGDNVLTFTAAGTMEDLATINASANTAGVVIDTSAAALTQAITITGTAADDTIVLGANDVVNAGDGDDDITLANLAQVTGGAGEDTFVMTASANQVSYASILDFSTADDSIVTLGTTFNDTKITLAANAVFSDYVEAAAAGAARTISWFQFGGNTYIVSDEDAAANFVNGKDAIVEIVGLVDFSEATLTGSTLAFA